MLAGDFNGWDAQAQPMVKGSDGVWSATVKLKPGAYQYKFVVDGEWSEDHTNSHRAWTAEGTVNSVVEVS
jgi:1,4-alpha-glucan branching enzyme